MNSRLSPGLTVSAFATSTRFEFPRPQPLPRGGCHISVAICWHLPRLAAFLDLLEDELISDPAGWLEMPLVAGYSPRYLDLYRAGRIDLLFELASLRTTPQQALDEFAPDWHQRLRLEHEVFEAGDGHLSIRRRR